jgi:putative hydrolase of the HAD superfamily
MMNPQNEPAAAALRFLVFDLDETLYPPHTGLFDEVGRRIHRYLEERMGFPAEEVAQVRRRYYERYGTTLRGLQLHHQVDSDDYLRYVHDVDVSLYLRPDPALDAALGTLAQEQVIFTNATAEYARRVLHVLGISRHFQRILDIYALGFHCKPNPEAYRILLEALPASGPECLLIEDSLRNLRAGKAAGMHTLLVNPESGGQDGADWTVTSAAQVPEVVQEIGSPGEASPG